MAGELFFNGRMWRQLLKDEQAVRFLELLYNRAGGAQAPDLNLNEVNNIVNNISEGMSRNLVEGDRLRHRLQAIENQDHGHALDSWHRGGYL